jgi:disulfide oxidoreductase YuzD
MKKIEINQKEIFEIAYLVKQKFSNKKFQLHFIDKKIIIKTPKFLEKLKIEELKTFLKLKYPHLQIIFSQDY